LKQLVRNRPSIADPVARLYDLHATHNTRPSLDEIFGALQSVLTIYSTVYVIIDALDECPDKDGTRSQLLAKLRNLQRKTDLHLMTTSRLIPDIVQEFNGMPMLEVRASDADVQQFVASQIYRLPKCIQRDNKLQGSVQDKIVEAVDGMYVNRTSITSTVSFLITVLGFFLPASILIRFSTRILRGKSTLRWRSFPKAPKRSMRRMTKLFRG
jgi:hypothetical protein